MDEHQAKVLRAELDRIAQQIDAACSRLSSPTSASPMAVLAIQHLNAALDSVRKAADEITVGFGLRD
jgi:hypothetical protein